MYIYAFDFALLSGLSLIYIYKDKMKRSWSDQNGSDW